MQKMLQTERLILRNYQITDLEDYWELVSGKDVGPMAGWPAYTNIEDAKKRLEEIEVKDPFQFAIVLKEKNKVIGSITVMEPHGDITNGISLSQDAKEIGYILNENYWSNGYMTEALKEIMRYIFEDLNISMIVIGHAKANIGSGKVQEKAGFEIVGEVPNYRIWVDGSSTSLVQRIMTKEEYEFKIKGGR